MDLHLVLLGKLKVRNFSLLAPDRMHNLLEDRAKPESEGCHGLPCDLS